MRLLSLYSVHLYKTLVSLKTLKLIKMIYEY